jgi:hypothetical protein
MFTVTAASWGRTKRPRSAEAETAEVLKLNPQFNMELSVRMVGPKGKVLADHLRWAADLHKTGLK